MIIRFERSHAASRVLSALTQAAQAFPELEVLNVTRDPIMTAKGPIPVEGVVMYLTRAREVRKWVFWGEKTLVRERSETRFTFRPVEVDRLTREAELEVICMTGCSADACETYYGNSVSDLGEKSKALLFSLVAKFLAALGK